MNNYEFIKYSTPGKFKTWLTIQKLTQKEHYSIKRETILKWLEEEHEL